MNNACLPTPSLTRRLAAMFYDSLLVIALVMLVTALYIGLRIAIIGEDTVKNSDIAATGFLFQLTILVSVFIFFCIFWRIKGQTLGMQVWRNSPGQ